jgi:hypothetical protein
LYLLLAFITLKDLIIACEEEFDENNPNLPRSQSAQDLTREEAEEKAEHLIEDHLDELEKIRVEQVRKNVILHFIERYDKIQKNKIVLVKFSKSTLMVDFSINHQLTSVFYAHYWCPNDALRFTFL